VNFQLKSTDKVAIIGKNGAGKTTLLRAIRDRKDPSIQLSESVNMAYLSQDQGDLMGADDTIYDTFFDIGFKTYDEISDYLATFCFPLEKMKAKIATLSGGEKNILGLAKICRSNSNLLILDEPVSHLDTYAQVALETALQNYNGGILMISHDFYSIVNCMDYVLLIENKTVRKIRMRKFRKMIYADHFDKDYLLNEQAKKSLELRIEQALLNDNFSLAKDLLVDLELLIEDLGTTK
ncbi:MAG: ATP-binding cassette domain-containing protein, partial [Eubacteriales bacterium]